MADEKTETEVQEEVELETSKPDIVEEETSEKEPVKDEDVVEDKEPARSADGSDSEEDDDEDEPKVTIDDEPYNFRAAQKQQPQSQQPKQPTIDFEAAQAALDVDINSLEDKPWRKPGADLNDYFNYGFDESTWRMYCDRQKKMKGVINEMMEVQEAHRIPVINHQPVVTPLVVPQPMVPHIPRDMGIVSGGSSRISRDHSSHRRSRSPHSSRHHARSKERIKERKRSRSRDSGHRRKRRSRSRERHDDRHKFKRHKSSRRA